MNFSTVVYIFGSLSIFIYGMILLSDSLEKAAGERLKDFLSAMTNNRFIGLFTGFMVTAIIQSSSATTVMVVSFVNAGLLSLSQAIGVIMGANIGTTVTAWIINLTNMKTDMNFVAYIALTIGIVMSFFKGRKSASWGTALLGFGFIFVGLTLLKNSVPRPGTIEEGNFLYDFFMWIPKDSWWPLLLLILIGTVFTIIVQSSSVMMAFTVTLAAQGYIDYYHGAALVLGENIGTTITANIAGIAGNKIAKKAALAHTLFNLIGVSWMMIPPVFKMFTGFSNSISGGNHAVSLAIFHTSFNITNSFLLIWFVPQIERLLMTKKDEKVEYSLLDMNKGLFQTPELAILEATREIDRKLVHIIRLMFNTNYKHLASNRDRFTETHDIKELTSTLQKQSSSISGFLTKLMHNNISSDAVMEINRLLIKVKSIENIGHSSEKIASIIKKCDQHNSSFFNKNKEELDKLLDSLITLFQCTQESTDQQNRDRYHKGMIAEEEVDRIYFKLKRHTIAQLRKKNSKNSITNGLLFIDLIKELEKTGDNLQQIITVSYDEDIAGV